MCLQGAFVGYTYYRPPKRTEVNANQFDNAGIVEEEEEEEDDDL